MDHGEHLETIEIEHPHAFDPSEPRTSIIAVLGIVTAVLLLVIGVAIQFYYTQDREARIYREVLAPVGEQINTLRNNENWELTHYQYIDKSKGVVRMPIAEAMKLLEREAAENRLRYPTAAYAVKTPEQLAAQQPAVSQPGAQAQDAAAQPGTGQQPGAGQPGVTKPVH